jgi:hypothetical protein
MSISAMSPFFPPPQSIDGRSILRYPAALRIPREMESVSIRSTIGEPGVRRSSRPPATGRLAGLTGRDAQGGSAMTACAPRWPERGAGRPGFSSVSTAHPTLTPR